MTADFSSLLKRPAGKANRPKVLPQGLYPGKVKSWAVDDKNQNKTPYLRINCGPTEWPDNVDDADKVQEGPDGQLIPINLMNRTLSRDVYLRGKDGSDQMYRVDDLLKSFGVELNGRSYEEAIPDLVGRDCIIEVGIYVNEKTGEPGNQCNSLKGVQ